jgi:hypothetical protein
VEKTNVAATFDYQTITLSFPITVKGVLAHVFLSGYDTLTKSGAIQVTTQIYPLYAFADQSAPGDYYLMHQEVTIPNAQWYNGRWTNKHGGVYVRLCAFFMNNFKIRNYLKGLQSGKTVTLHNTSPQTTVGQTVYTSGFSWSLEGSLTGGTQNGKPVATMTAKAGVTFSNTQSRTVSDVDIANLSGGTEAAWSIKFNNLAYFESNSIKEPALPSRSTQLLYTDWVWRVQGTADNSTGSPFSNMVINLTDTTWGGSKFYSGKADFGTTTFKPWIDAQAVSITPPNRVPTAELKITNNSSDYISEIKIWKNGNAADSPDYTLTKTIPPKGFDKIWVPVGSGYKVQLKAGNSLYHSQNGGFSLSTRGEAVEVFYDGDNSPDFASGALTF